MLSIVQEELEIKKKTDHYRMEKVDKENTNQMGMLMTNMEKLTGSEAEGFALLRQIMLSPLQPLMYPHYQPNQSYPNVALLRESVKAAFHMIANDRRRSRIADRRSQTIAKRDVSI